MRCLSRGSRPDRLTEVRPQERVLRRTVEQKWTKLRKSSGSSSHCLLLPSRLSKCPRSFLRTPWKHGLCLSSSPPGQGGIQILAAMVAEACGRLCDHAAPFQQVFVEFVEVPQPQFIDSMVGFPVASQRQGSQCKLCRRRRFARCRSWIVVDMPLVCQRQGCGSDSAENCVFRKCSTLKGWSMFPLLQFIDKVGRSCDLAVTELKGFLSHFAHFSRSSGLSRS